MDLAIIIDEVGEYDISIKNGQPVIDDGLETYILICLFTDARADDTDTLPDNGMNRRGWWGEVVLGEKWGSKLWLLSREKMTDETLFRAQRYCKEALAILKDEGLADEISVDVTRVGDTMILLSVSVLKIGYAEKTYQYYYNWESQIYSPVHERV